MSETSDARRALSVLDARETKGIETCTTCPKLCRWACPVAEVEARETTSPWALVVASGLVKRGQASPDVFAEVVHHCSGCGACTEACLHGNDVPLLVALARQRAHRGGPIPAGISELRGHFAVAQNPHGRGFDAVLEAARAAGAPVHEASDAWLFPGCELLASGPDALVSLLRGLAVRGAASPALPAAMTGCCGLPLFAAGDLAGFRAHAERFAERVRGAKRLLVADPACREALQVRYADVGVPLDVELVDLTRAIADALGVRPEDGQVGVRGAPRVAEDRGPEGPAAAYLDCCRAARAGDLVSRPRALVELALGEAPVELAGPLGRDADCCGAGHLLPETAPETATALAEARLAAFRATGARCLVTVSPRCAAHLRRVDPHAPVVELTSLLARLP
jgi:Fe-S oxidoreductase